MRNGGAIAMTASLVPSAGQHSLIKRLTVAHEANRSRAAPVGHRGDPSDDPRGCCAGPFIRGAGPTGRCGSKESSIAIRRLDRRTGNTHHRTQPASAKDVRCLRHLQAEPSPLEDFLRGRDSLTAPRSLFG